MSAFHAHLMNYTHARALLHMIDPKARCPGGDVFSVVMLDGNKVPGAVAIVGRPRYSAWMRPDSLQLLAYANRGGDFCASALFGGVQMRLEQMQTRFFITPNLAPVESRAMYAGGWRPADLARVDATGTRRSLARPSRHARYLYRWENVGPVDRPLAFPAELASGTIS